MANKCYHTGLPQSMCGHCNGTSPLEVEPPSVYAVKPREKLGESTGERGGMELAAALIHGSHYTHAPRSQWGVYQTFRTIASLGMTQRDAERLADINPAQFVLDTPKPQYPANMDGQHTKLRHTARKPIPQFASESMRRARMTRRIDNVKHIRAGQFSNNPRDGGIE